MNYLEQFFNHYQKILHPALKETLYMSITSTSIGFILGLGLGILLFVTKKDGLYENVKFYRVLDFFVNIVRSFPFLVLIIALIPFTKLLIGKSIGTTAAIVPLTIGVAPFIAKLVQNAFNEVDYGIIEAAKSYGASRLQIIFKVVLYEALPALVNAATLTLIVVIGYSAMAGIVGGGGLGDVANRYGYQRFKTDIMIETVIVLIILVQVVQIWGDFVEKITRKGKNTLLYISIAILIFVCIYSGI
ncbi:methionine ABC transporter permease [Campylobacter sp. MG1]|uniref:methionine ABC transporter permease n=1 Tax=Campylobacter sp. MG1 TaxID=2976332 RepID=UPI00226D2884|nr:methionine ABC transporter permease [Campylobacter sp. MG1]